MERVNFYNDAEILRDAEITFKYHKNEINRMIPGADIQHVGSTAIPDSVTKGDLDIQVRVSPNQFNHAVNILSEMYDTNNSSIKTKEFRAFKDDETNPPLGIQLTVIGSEFDFFWKFRDVLLQNMDLKNEYDALKLKYENSSMSDYREAKDIFFEEIQQTIEFKALDI
ncbi:GrpB family protein [Salinicoccus sp. YB14-2]|uniref:GrpB family protein n=1 Tax=Salinicoccus sp. YB14-2 TaxID=1572701 RepID=UPI0006906092|nr:GrpB family protein [Salinicoccus sp. YB14-2]